MYKRSEATAHGTRDYLVAKWQASFPNTGFWTYIKYTIVEQHVYGEDDLAAIAWKDQAALVFGFFQMAGFNRYDISKGGKSQAKRGPLSCGTTPAPLPSPAPFPYSRASL